MAVEGSHRGKVPRRSPVAPGSTGVPVARSRQLRVRSRGLTTPSLQLCSSGRLPPGGPPPQTCWKSRLSSPG